MGAAGTILFSRGRRVENFRGGNRGQESSKAMSFMLRLTSLQDCLWEWPRTISGKNRNWMHGKGFSDQLVSKIPEGLPQRAQAATDKGPCGGHCYMSILP